MLNEQKTLKFHLNPHFYATTLSKLVQISPDDVKLKNLGSQARSPDPGHSTGVIRTHMLIDERVPYLKNWYMYWCRHSEKRMVLQLLHCCCWISVHQSPQKLRRQSKCAGFLRMWWVHIDQPVLCKRAGKGINQAWKQVFRKFVYVFMPENEIHVECRHTQEKRIRRFFVDFIGHIPFMVHFLSYDGLG